MDPNATLKRLRDLTEKVIDKEESIDEDEQIEFAEHFRALDEWLSKHGFLPQVWDRL